MLQAHSPLWHYLWLAPHVLQVVLAVLMWRAGLHKVFPVFLAYTLIEAAEEFTLYALDVVPSVQPETFWKAFWGGLVLEGLLKFAVAGELFFHLLKPFSVLAKVGNRLITCAGVVLVLVAAVTAGMTTPASPYWLISGAHALRQSMYVIESGLILFIVAFATYFHLAWDRRVQGITIGLGILSCEHLATWAISAAGVLASRKAPLDLVNMATYHVCVLIWMYYLLTPGNSATTPKVSLPDNNLVLWNQELERLLQR
jgi:hypothetical protein